MTVRQQIYLAAQLSLPSIFAQISSVVMQYIDASMVGSLGANAAASIGLVSTTTWLFMGLCSSVAAGFAVQVAHLLGAKDDRGARAVLRQALVLSSVFALLLATVGGSISHALPRWLGGDEAILSDASTYFLIYALSLPFLQLHMLAGSMLRCSGNVSVPSILNVLMCLLDVVFNLFLIFPTREYEIGQYDILPAQSRAGGKRGGAGYGACHGRYRAAHVVFSLFPLARTAFVAAKGETGIRPHLPASGPAHRRPYGW